MHFTLFPHLLKEIPQIQAGMTSYGLDQIAEFRLQALSFFLFVLLLLGWGLKRLWNGLRGAFPSWPILTYRWALGLLMLFGLLIHVVLTMIAGARELMTPAAWEKDGHRYRLRAVSGLAQVPREFRKSSITAMKERIWRFAREHDGKVPSGAFSGEIPWTDWQAPTGGFYAYLPHELIGGGRELLLYEPTEAGSERFVVLRDGSIEQWNESRVFAELTK